MKTITVESFFKLTADEKKAGRIVKRPNVSWSFSGFEPVMLDADIVDIDRAHIVEAINSVLESYGAQLLSDNKADESYVPASSDITLEAWYKWFTAESKRGKKAVTKETLDAFASFYVSVMVEHASKPMNVATSGAACIRSKFVNIMGNSSALMKMGENLAMMSELCDSDDSLSVQFAQHSAVVDALAKIVVAATAVVTADDL